MSDTIFESLKSFQYDHKALWDSLEHVATWGDFKGFSGHTHTNETKKKMSEAHKGKTLSEETKKKLSEANMGRPRTEAQMEQLRQLNLRPRSAESNAKRSAATKGIQQSTSTCPHCGLTGSKGNIARWHGINCKEYTQP